MRVEKEDTDYRIVLTEEEIKEACTRSVDSLSGLEKFYPWLYAKVEGLEKEVDEVLALCCTGDVFMVLTIQVRMMIYILSMMKANQL